MLATMDKHLVYFFAFTWLAWTHNIMTDAYHQGYAMKVEPDLNCDFERANTCYWRAMSTSLWIDWATGHAFSFDYTHGPKTDHTSGSRGGHILRRISPSPAFEGTAILSSPSITTNYETCLSFWYFSAGHQHGSIKVHKVGDRDEKTELLSIYGPQGSRWYRAVVKTGSGSFRLEIEAHNTREEYYGAIAIDDITFSYQECQERESEFMYDSSRLDCDFEDDLCSWWTDVNDGMHWRLTEVGWELARHGKVFPPHSNGTSYAVLKTGGFSSSSVKSDLRSPTLSVDSHEACMSFWYKFEGKMAETLSVKRVDHGHDMNSQSQTLFSATQQTQRWTQAFVTLREGKSFHILISGRTRLSGHGTIAVDDIHMTHGRPCPKINQEELINCDFESDLCRWYVKKENEDEGHWFRNKGSTPTNSTGPSHDHTTGDGYYIFLDASKDEKAKLHSSLFDVDSSGASLSFWYYMYGDDVHRLQLAYQKKSNDTGVNIIWYLEGSQEDRWVKQNVCLNSKQDAYLTFTAERNYFPRGDIALDDISISFGGFCGNDKPTTTTVPSTEVPEDTTLPTTTFVTPFRTDPTPLATPQLIVKGEINPAYTNSRVELRCQHPHADEWILWWFRSRTSYGAWTLRSNETSLVFDEIEMEDAGTYKCELSSFRDWYNQVEIRVVPDPRPSLILELEVDGVDIHRGDVDLEVNSVLKLTCGRAVKDGVYIWKTTSSAFSDSFLPNTRFLIINGTRSEYSGIYSCRISKDSFLTDKSNQFNIIIKPGKRCKDDYECKGSAYKYHCRDNRCECETNAVIHGRECKRRPHWPRIVTYPAFQEFSIGESFYLMCKAQVPVPTTLTYSFSQNSATAVDSLRIMKFTNATEEDSGQYMCFVTYDQIQSKPSNTINIVIKDFVNLNCDFGEGFCGWSQRDDLNSAMFVVVSDTTSDFGKGRSGPYILLGASNSKVPNRAMLLSPTIERTSLDSCLTFWYRMHGPDVYSLSVWKRSKDAMFEDEYVGREVWAAIGETGSHWIQQNVTIAKNKHFHIAFEAIGQVAIDDIVFTYRGGC